MERRYDDAQQVHPGVEIDLDMVSNDLYELVMAMAHLPYILVHSLW